jgi:hypothetical protein
MASQVSHKEPAICRVAARGRQMQAARHGSRSEGAETIFGYVAQQRVLAPATLIQQRIPESRHRHLLQL